MEPVAISMNKYGNKYCTLLINIQCHLLSGINFTFADKFFIGETKAGLLAAFS